MADITLCHDAHNCYAKDICKRADKSIAISRWQSYTCFHEEWGKSGDDECPWFLPRDKAMPKDNGNG